jgi:hypothetical protein
MVVLKSTRSAGKSNTNTNSDPQASASVVNDIPPVTVSAPVAKETRSYGIQVGKKKAEKYA